MCLTSPKPYTGKRKEIIAYKILWRTSRGNLVSELVGTKYEIGKTYKAKPSRSPAITLSQKYKKGFHAWAFKKDAKRLRKSTWAKNWIVVKVRLSDITFVESNPHSTKVYVANTCEFLEVVE